jgi:hypothetical protein
MTTPTLQQVIEQVEKLSLEDKEQLLVYLQEEAEFEANLLRQSLGDALLPDGSIDFDAIYKRGKSGYELHDEFPGVIDENGHIGDVNE